MISQQIGRRSSRPDHAADGEQFVTALIESAPVAIYHTDASGDLIYSNQEYRRIFSLEPGHGPDAWSRRVHPGDRARMQRAWAEFCDRPVPTRFESYRTMADDGVVKHYSEQVVPAIGVAGWVGTITDFTDLVTTRDNLRKAETLFANTFDQAPFAIVYADRQGNVLRFNAAFCAMLGFAADEFDGLASTDFIDPQDATAVASDVERLWNGEVDFVDVEKRCLRRDGSPFWVRTMTSLVRSEGSAPEYSVEFLRDVTTRKETDEQLERAQRELVIASRQAGMAEIATNVLHNVGNILNSVNISASLVTERVKQSKVGGVPRIAALLTEQGARLADFVSNDERGKRVPEYLTALGDQLMSDRSIALDELNLLRENLEHIKDTVSMQQSYAKRCGVIESVEVADLVEDSLRLNAGAFARHGVTVQREFGCVPPITVDRHKVLQILVNLVRNAKYACDESGRIDKLLTLRIEPLAAGVRICVIDNGAGIRAEHMPRLFTHGFTTRASGHGFGLHSAALAAQELSGSLRAMSEGPGCGATFVLDLPANSPDAAHG